ncbi:helix-turn-helix domain-containing protein [Luteipulveratus sp. YIM 133132]|uniref:winged helix-turn-helix transcriptional regulator n=1 Tax=Luteipulveratus flavus TaxID=3031728 RepID=UPI0023AE8FD9|nr:helix-turn-helix domain-containing protein [Luteipulveratus sp. YIM 133132]MDE9367179.1 helix-turn-helix domain-containing protein [Luteipulveratus sp. YIM 133132]
MATRTAAGRRAEAKVEYDAFMAQCKSRRLLDRLTDKWVTLVLCTLGEGDLRYSEISRHIAGVSQKMLTQTLRSLERDGLITRTVTPTVPVTVEYAITELGRSLLVVVGQMKVWAETHMDQVQAHRDDYDRRTA